MMTLDPNVFSNPLAEPIRDIKSPDPCIMVIFGATGDLTGRKLLPAIYNLASDGQLPAHFACVGFARRDKSNDDFRSEMSEAISQFSRTKPIDQELWKNFSEQIYYHRSNFNEDEGYEGLRKLLDKLDSELGTNGNRLFYLSTPPAYFPDIIKKLHEHKLVYDVNKTHDKWSRVIIEKPFGHDFQSAQDLQTEITQYLDESQIYRIDHYLGKETVQNLLVLRFANPIFESTWNNKSIDHIEITVGEEIGIGTRGNFFEKAGILRDIVQNHMMQVLSLVAMEPPNSLDANAIRDEKVKVLEAIRAFPKGEFDKNIIRGQYGQGYVDGAPVKSSREEDDVDPQSNVETFVAMKLFIDNWRWADVPFFLRAGKRLPKKATEIAITFKKAPGFLFKDAKGQVDPNILVIRIQPDEGVSLKMNCKVPGIAGPIQPVKMDFRYSSYFGASPPEAYERLICDCMAGDSTLFARIDEVMASWKLFTPVIKEWNRTTPENFPNYSSGTWGPAEAETLMEGTGFNWRLL